jgi:hypothetical protein
MLFSLPCPQNGLTNVAGPWIRPPWTADMFSLMVLLNVHVIGMAILKTEGDAPGPIDVNRVAGWTEPPQGMEIKTGKSHVFDLICLFQCIQASQGPFL